jgi:DNA-binding CsgD family transcriptional regulator
MSRITVIFLIFSALWLFIGLRALRKRHRDCLHLLFAALCLTMVVWTLFLGIGYSLDDIETIVLFMKIAYIGGFLFSPVNLHFFLAISRTGVKPLLLAVIYAPFAALLVSNSIQFFIFSGYKKVDGVWLGVLQTGSTWVRVYTLLVLLTFALSFLVILLWRRRTKINKERIQSLLILVIFSLTYFTSLVATLLLPFLGIHGYQTIGIILFGAYIIGLSLLISRFQFLDIKTPIPVDEVIENISELVFLLNPGFRIKEVNGAVGTVFPNARETLPGRSFLELVDDNGDLARLAAGNVGAGPTSVWMMVRYRTDAGALPARARVSVTRDRFNDVSGFLVISSEIKEAGKLRERFRITPREIQVIGLIASGCSYRETAERLRIAEKTVEAHLTSVYNKLGIRNRIELQRIAMEYGLTAEAFVGASEW